MKTVTFQNLQYSVPTTKTSASINQHDLISSSSTLFGSTKSTLRVLRDVSGIAYAGQVLAIMGGSGSGKSTTLDVLSYRTPAATTSGSIYIDGWECDADISRRVIGYVVQDDRLMPNLTVGETLTYAARLRHVASRNQIAQRVTKVLEELELIHVRDSRVGDQFTRGISGGQRRRVSISLQLLMEPQVLLLDEPTSGLDSTTAFHVMETLQAIAKAGRTIITTIHQPASEIFPLIDRFLLLSRGATVFHGPRDHLLPYFSSIGYPCPGFSNPMDFLVDISSINHRTLESERASSQMVENLLKQYQQSAAHSTVEGEIATVRTGSTSNFNALQPRIQLSYLTLANVLMSRMFLNLVRDLNGLRIRLFQGLLFAIFLFAFMGRVSLEPISIQTRFGYLYESCASTFFMGVLSACGLYPSLRDCFFRERNDGLYGTGSFIFAYTIHALPTDVASMMLFTLFMHIVVGLYLTAASFFMFFFCVFSSLHFGESLALMFLSLLRDPNLAHDVAGGISQGSVILSSGFLRSVTTMPRVVVIAGYATLPKYVSELITYFQFRDLEFDCPYPPDLAPLMCPYLTGLSFSETYYPDAADNVMRDVLLTLVFVIVGRFLPALLLIVKKDSF